MTSTSDIYSLLKQGDAEYDRKMNHPIPQARVISREWYLLSAAKDRVILDIGATGPMHEALKEAARRCYGIDILEKDEADYVRVDLDRVTELPHFEGVEIIIAGEVIEHLSNAGHFLDLLRGYDCPVLLTTPNAFSEAGRKSVLRGIEQVNREHTCYYSWHTLSVLLERHGWGIDEFYWYNGKPLTAEGMICRISKRTR